MIWSTEVSDAQSTDGVGSGLCSDAGGSGATGGTAGRGGGGGSARSCEPGGQAGAGGGPVCTNNGDCGDDDCVCCDCDTDFFCADPTNCVDDGNCNTFTEGCVCDDCTTHPACQG